MEKKEYIERGAALLAIAGQPSELHYPSWYKGNIMEVPAADVVEVVRCNNCKYSGMYAFGCGEHLACLDIEDDGFVRMATAVNDDDYCSRGERKEK